MNRITNFALLMQALEVPPKRMAELLNTDTSLISRWRTGGRKLMPGRHWVREIAECFYDLDDQQGSALVRGLLLSFNPDQKLNTRAQCIQALEEWLVAPDQMNPQYRQYAAKTVERLTTTEENDKSNLPLAGSSQSVGGTKAVRKMALTFIEEALKLAGTHEVLFFCPEGLELLTSDPVYSAKLMEMLNKAFRAGCHLNVILRTEYKPSDVAAFSGHWMAAHLDGYVDSYYYDDFSKTESSNMIAVIKDQLALGITYGEHPRNSTATIYYDQPTIAQMYSKVKKFASASAIRQQQNFFSNPQGYFARLDGFQQKPCYAFMRLPQFGLMPLEEYKTFFRLEDEDIELLNREFQPLVQEVELLDPNVVTRHVFCSTTIEEVLLEKRRMLPALSDICGRRVFLSAQGLVDLLKRVRDLMNENRNYEVCFLSDDAFVDLSLHVVSWGSTGVICWNGNKSSAASTEYHITSALHGFCSTVWNKIPTTTRSRTSTLKKIDQWLKKAKLYGLDA